MTMLCLTISQPYAALVIAGLKRREYRVWRAPGLIGRRIAIHAAQSVDAAALALLERHGLPLVTGAVLGSVRVAAMRRTGDGWAWLLDDTRPYSRPVPATGKQKLWTFARSR
jgi:hypothetical protein